MTTLGWVTVIVSVTAVINVATVCIQVWTMCRDRRQ